MRGNVKKLKSQIYQSLLNGDGVFSTDWVSDILDYHKNEIRKEKIRKILIINEQN